MPPPSGEVEAPMRVVLLSKRASLTGEGDAIVASDLAELLMAVDGKRRVAVIVDTHHSTIDLGFFVRIARDFPPAIAILVVGDAHEDRRVFHDHGVFRAHFEPDGALRMDALDRAALVERVREMLARQPTPLGLLKKK